MSSPILSDAQVRGRYCDGVYLQTGRLTDGEDFDRWLAEHDARVLEKFAPLDLIGRVVYALMVGSRENLLLSDELNTKCGRSARRRAGLVGGGT